MHGLLAFRSDEPALRRGWLAGQADKAVTNHEDAASWASGLGPARRDVGSPAQKLPFSASVLWKARWHLRLRLQQAL